MLARDDSPWYPTMKLYRQENSGDWNSILMKLTYDLNKFVNLKFH